MDNNFENSNPMQEENVSINSEPSAQPVQNVFAEPASAQSQPDSQAQQVPPAQNTVPPFVPPYAAYCDTSSGYIPYGYYPPKKEAVKNKSKNKKLGIIVALVLVVISLISITAFAAVALRNGGTQKNDKNSVKAEIPLAEAQTDTDADDNSAKSIYQKTYESNVGVIVYARTKSTIASEGSGVILPTVMTNGKDNGKTYIVTCAHVLETSSSYKTVVKTHDGKQYDAKIVGLDRKTDLGVLSIDATGLKAAEFAPSESLSVGDTVYALGNPGGSTFFGSFTNGMISAIGRPVNSPVGYEVPCIQHTAPINPGNSGGALLNEFGQVIGINSSKIASTEYEGMGFSVPSETVKEIVESIISNGYVTGRAVLGITFFPSTYSQVHSAVVQANDLPSGSLIINSIASYSDLANKDVKEGDMVIGFNGKDLEDYNELLDYVENGSVGDTVKLKICRIDQNYKITTFEIEAKLVEDTGDLMTENNN